MLRALMGKPATQQHASEAEPKSSLSQSGDEVALESARLDQFILGLSQEPFRNAHWGGLSSHCLVHFRAMLPCQDQLTFLRREIYKRFFTLAPAGQDLLRPCLCPASVVICSYAERLQSRTTSSSPPPDSIGLQTRWWHRSQWRAFLRSCALCVLHSKEMTTDMFKDPKRLVEERCGVEIFGRRYCRQVVFSGSSGMWRLWNGRLDFWGLSGSSGHLGPGPAPRRLWHSHRVLCPLRAGSQAPVNETNGPPPPPALSK